MNKKNFNTAYKLDEVLNIFDNHQVLQDFNKKTLIDNLKVMRDNLKPIVPKKDFYDEIWKFWVKLPSGSFQDYLQEIAKEEDVPASELEEELKFDWEYNYPEPVKWYRLICCSSYEGKEFYVSFGNYFLMLNEKNKLRGHKQNIEQQQKLLSYIQLQLSQIISEILKNPNQYYQKLENNLSKRYRFGRIKRSDLWENLKDVKRLDKELGKKAIKKLTEILPQLKHGQSFDKMTANNFFKYCAIGYDANNYFTQDSNLQPIDKYKRKADMRDEGLTEINGNSTQAFHEWYFNRPHKNMGHPWEICSGGNSTHISLYVVNENESKDKWRLILAGSSRVRVIETIKIALALYEHGIIVQLRDAEAILRMVTGSDYIGLVPSDVTPRYCHSFFPEKDKIIDFINLWYEIEDEEFEILQKYIYWYPLDRLEIVK